jgi:plastocyanin
MMRSLRIATIGAFAALVVAACSSNDNTGTTTPSSNPPAATTTSAAPTTSSGSGGGTDSGASQATGTITIQNFQFGEPLQVKPGAKITVVNKDSQRHNVVADDGKGFKTDLLDQNQSATFTAPSTPGTYTFSCTVHANMTRTGTLVVA